MKIESFSLRNAVPEAMSSEGVGISLADFLRVLRVRAKIIASTAVLVVAVTIGIVTQITPLYSATALVLLDQRKNSVEDTAAVLSGLPSDQSTVQNQVQIIQSLSLAGRVVDRLNLANDPTFVVGPRGIGAVLKALNPVSWFGGAKTQAHAAEINVAREAAVHKLLSQLTVTPVASSTAIQVIYSSEDRERALQMANAIAQAYVDDQLEAKFEATKHATDWLAGRISEMAKQVQAAEAAVEEYKAVNNITTTAGGVTVVEQQIVDINRQMILARAELAEKQAIYNRLAELARQGRAADAPQVLSQSLIATLRAQEIDLNRQLADLTTKYGARHPKMLDLQSQKANLEAKIKEEVERVVESQRSEMQTAAAHVASLQASLQEYEKSGADQNKTGVQLTSLRSNATSARAMYEAFLARLNRTEKQEGIQTPDARVISQAELPGAPSYPKKSLIIGLSIPAGFMLGLFFALLAERLDHGFRTTEQLESMIRLPVLSTIPEVGGSKGGSKEGEEDNFVDAAVVNKPTSSFAEAMRSLHLGIKLSNVDTPPRCVIITSSVPGEGKTTLAFSLARLAAQSGLRTVLVDGDLRRPKVASVLKSPEDGPDLLDYLTQTKPLAECLIRDDITPLQIIQCRKPPANPADVLASRVFEDAVLQLKRDFDLVVFDSAPVLPVTDTRILGRLADAVLFAVRWEKTPREAVVNAIRLLHDAKIPVIGVAMTRADLDRFRYYNYGYQDYHNYTQYYES